MAWLSLVVVSAVCFAACGKIEIVGGPGNSTDMAGGNGNNDLRGVQPMGDLAGQPVAMAKATPTDQPSGGVVFAPLVGVGVRLESTGSNDPKGMSLSYAWKVLSAPSGSTINDAALQNASTATAGFVPDRGGDYQIQLTVSTPDSRSGATTITVTAQTIPLFFVDIQVADMRSSGLTLSSIRSDGTGKKAIGCPSYADYQLLPDEDPILFSSFGTLATYRVGYKAPDPVTGIEPPARMISAVGSSTDAGGLEFTFSIAEEDSDCATKMPKPVAKPAAGYPFAPVWSPNRTRFLYSTVDADNEAAVKIAVATDTETTPISGLGAVIPAFVQPAWVDDETIIFAAREGTGPFPIKIYKAKLTGAVASDVALWADCTTASAEWLALQGFEYRNGSVFLGANPEDKEFLGYNVIKITPPMGTTTCGVTNLTGLGPQSSARDFALSPDGKWLVYAKPEVDFVDMAGGKGGNGPPALDLYIMDVSVGTPTKLVGAVGTIEFGPQFIANGRQIMFYAGPATDVFANKPADFGTQSFSWQGLSVINVDGTNPRALLGGSAVIPPDGPPLTFLGPFIGANYNPFTGGCGIDPLQTPLSAVASSLLLVAGIALALRRRKS